MVPDRIEREVLINAPVEIVWSIVSEPEHVARWLSDSAAIDARPDGELTIAWEDYGAARGRVERIEPPHLLAFRWMSPTRARDAVVEIREENSTLVEFRLSAAGEGTRLCVVESGFAGLEGSDEANASNAESHVSGWADHLDELVDYAAQVRASV
ncbi:MAG TPA: SRPBCC family protein [Solirubrobacteraceae bacterium]|nr:SRPBCC family protein [Solirubrobacteraceae bacterium]